MTTLVLSLEAIFPPAPICYNEAEAYNPADIFVSDYQAQLADQIWVNTREGAEKTGYNRQYVKLLAMKIWRQPESERPIQIRKRSNGFELWLPDLLAYMNSEGHGPYLKDSPRTQSSKADPSVISSRESRVKKIWVNVSEAAEITGYNRGHMWRLVNTMWNQPEDERPVKLRRRTTGYELWLPDLIGYMEKEARGPYSKQSERR